MLTCCCLHTQRFRFTALLYGSKLVILRDIGGLSPGGEIGMRGQHQQATPAQKTLRQGPLSQILMPGRPHKMGRAHATTIVEHVRSSTEQAAVQMKSRSFATPCTPPSRIF